VIFLKEKLLQKIGDKTITVGVVGLGYVGLPLAVEKAKAGYKTIGFDIQTKKVDMVNAGINYIGDVVDADLKRLVDEKMLMAVADFDEISQADFIAICVPTPLDIHQQPNLEYVVNSTKDIAKFLKKETMVVLESTTYPGTTEEVIKPILEQGSGLVCGKDFYLGFSPERVDPGNLVYKTKNTPKVVGAIGKDAAEVISEMYRIVLDGDIHVVSSPSIAEMGKILENTYRNVNIGLINELAMLCHKMNINIWEVIESAKTKPYGFQAFYPGAGPGGHCIPLDPYYLSWKAREYNFHTSMIESSMMINDRMPEYIVERIAALLNKDKKPLNGSRVLILGVAYKQDIDDYRESPAIKVIGHLEKRCADVSYYDPYISEFNANGKIYRGIRQLSKEAAAGFDIAVITAAHTNVDYEFIAQNSKIVFDTKNATAKLNSKENIELL